MMCVPTRLSPNKVATVTMFVNLTTLIYHITPFLLAKSRQYYSKDTVGSDIRKLKVKNFLI